jgi:Mycobacterium membrane protein
MDLPEPPRPDQKSYPPAPQAPAPPGPGSKSKPSTGFIIAMVIVGLIVLGAIVNAFDGESSEDGDAPSSSVVVTYVVSGDSNQADVTYQNRSGDTSQESGVSLPWESGFATTPGAFVYISAQRGGSPGDITCSIEIDGQVAETNTSSGPYTICTASGSA